MGKTKYDSALYGRTWFDHVIRTTVDRYMPKKIIDAHIHMGPDLGVTVASPRGGNVDDEYVHCSFERIMEGYKEIFPKRDVTPVAVPFPFYMEQDKIDAVNDYLLDEDKIEYAFILGNPEKPDLTKEYYESLPNGKKKKVKGIKTYYLQYPLKKGESIPASKFIPEGICKVAADLDLAVAAHVAPTDENYEHILKMSEDTKFLMLHMMTRLGDHMKKYEASPGNQGLSMKDFRDIKIATPFVNKWLSKFIEKENIYFDLSCSNITMGLLGPGLVMREVLKNCLERVLGGTDNPYGLKVIEWPVGGGLWETPLDGKGDKKFTPYPRGKVGGGIPQLMLVLQDLDMAITAVGPKNVKYFEFESHGSPSDEEGVRLFEDAFRETKKYFAKIWWANPLKFLGSLGS